MRIIRFLLALLIVAIPAASFGQIGISVPIGPPALPVYDQPICPGDGYLWTPGYWAYDDSIADYYWVPGTWVLPPEEGFLWTPGYWGWNNGGYFFNEGYWGMNVGFYGGINYGYGYFGDGYGGGRWDHGHFFYNRSVNNVDIAVNRNVYNENVEHGNNSNRVSFNGGAGGVVARASAQQESAAGQRHLPAVAAQTEHMQAARANPAQRAASNRGNPPVAATPTPGNMNQRAPAAGRDNVQQPAAAARPAEAKPTVHPSELPAIVRPAPANSGNAKADQKYEQQQNKLIVQQNQERQKLQQQQDKEHQRANPAQTQQLEQKHQQQTQDLQQRHTSQQQSLQSRQPQPHPAESRPRK